jgi:cytochrome P450
MVIAPTLPRHVDPEACRADPLDFLGSARNRHGEFAVISDREAIFSRAGDCTGAVAVFGPDAVREVLSDIDLFGMPVSVAEKFTLPDRLTRLNRGLFSMAGDEHRRHQQLISPVLGTQPWEFYGANIANGWNAFRQELSTERELLLLDTMRRLALHVMTAVLFGDGIETGLLIQSYFNQRRALSGGSGARTLQDRRKLVQTGFAVENSLQQQLARLRRTTGEPGHPSCAMARLAGSRENEAWQPGDAELVAHGNVLFMSGSEPIAMSLAWTLLILSQRPDLSAAIRHEIGAAFGRGAIPRSISGSDLPLLHRVVLETLRVLPPNAIMVRLTSRSGRLLGRDLPARCEVILSPFVDHRDISQYPHPVQFAPDRWIDFQPRAFCYFPFGLGGRYCLGKSLATTILVSVLARIIQHHDVVLPEDINVDWKMDVTLMPSEDLPIRLEPAGRDVGSARRGRLTGPVLNLVQI